MTTTDISPDVVDQEPESPNPFRTLWVMFKSPGVVSHEIMSGNTTRYVHPRVVFIFFWVVFFVFASGNRLAPDLYGEMNNMPYSFVAKDLVEKTVKEKKTNLKAFTEAYASTSRSATLALLIFAVLLFIIPLRLINRSKKLSFNEHLVVSYEFITSVMIYWFIVLSWLLDDASIYLLIVVILALLTRFEMNAYKQSLARSVGNAALLTVIFFGIIVIYRTGIFFFTMWKL